MKLDDGEVHEGPAFDSCRRPPKKAFKQIIILCNNTDEIAIFRVSPQ